MKYLIDISQRQAQKIQKYLDEGQYMSISQFIITAIENQFNLEEDVLPIDLVGKDELQKAHHSVSNPVHLTTALEAYKITDMQNFYAAISPPKFDQIVLSSQGLPEKDVWIWGQVNKIFPVKIGLRILQKNLHKKQSIELNEFLETAAGEAAQIGNIIREYETRNNKERNEKISAALPQLSDEKSQSRYKFQFLAYQRKDGLLDGAMAILRFCNLEKKNGKTYIGLTEWGANFSNEINPVLDNGDLDNSLSTQEIEYYLNHISRNVIGESLALKWLLDKINKGINDRTLINHQLSKDYGAIWGDVTDAVINTQRSGLTARAFELGLIEKEKNGIYVTYTITEAGLKYLTSI
jgi:hypothetical protein